MKLLAAIAIACISAGCAQTIELKGLRPLITPAAWSLTDPSPTNGARSREYDPGEDFGVYRSERQLERMPFGGSMFGPWKVRPWNSRLERTLFVRGSNEPIRVHLSEGLPTIDFVQKDLHTIIHYIALRSGLQVILEGESNEKISVELPYLAAGDLTTEERAKALLRKLAEALDLDYIEDGTIIIIKRRPTGLDPANIVKADASSGYNVNFENHELVAAIMEAATVTETQVFVPAVSTGNDDEELRKIQEHRITLALTEATPEEILRELARLGELDIEVVILEDSVSGVAVGYQFKYRR